MFRRTLIATAALAALLPAGAASALTAPRTARFTATITGAQTTKWAYAGETYTDCHGTRTQKGDGTEVYRFTSAPARVLIQQSPTGTVSWKLGTWDPYSLHDSYALLAAARSTRHGKVVTSWTGGWCGHPRDETNPARSDCGSRRRVDSVTLDPEGRRLEVGVTPFGFAKPFDACPVNTPTGVEADGFTTTIGRLSARLVFGRRERIVVEDGRVYKRHDGTVPGVDALSTTHFRLVLARHGR